MRKLDIPLITACLLLVAFGWLALYSSALADQSMSILWRNLAYLVGAIAVFVAMYRLDYHAISASSRWLYLIAVLLLVVTLVFGSEIRGAHRWLGIGSLRVQTSEIVKLAIVVGLSKWLYAERGRINTSGILLRTAAFTVVPVILVILQPDLGSAITICAIWGGLLVVSRARLRILFAVTGLVILVAAFSWQYVLRDFQRNRILVFLNPTQDAANEGYNIRQSIIAVGSGMWLGQGLGQGVQSQLKFLPERRTDFAFASISEELGLVGAGSVVFLYVFLLWRVWYIAKNAKDNLGAYLALGVWWWMFVQGVVNMGMNMGLLPVTGVPLPLVSYGGSSLIITAASLGIVARVGKDIQPLRF